MYVFISYKQAQEPDHSFAKHVEERLGRDGHSVFRDETGLVPSEQWAQRLYKEILKCDTLIALVSNASLQSRWFLNEVDLAFSRDKRVLPVVFGDIDEALDFQFFKPRFMLTQWYRATGNFDKDADTIATVVREEATHNYWQLIATVSSKHGIRDPIELLEALMSILNQSHFGAQINKNSFVLDGLESVTGGRSRSIADSLAMFTKVIASMENANAANTQKGGRDEESKRKAWVAQRLSCLSEILQTAINLWDKQGEVYRERIRQFLPELEIKQ